MLAPALVTELAPVGEMGTRPSARIMDALRAALEVDNCIAIGLRVVVDEVHTNHLRHP